jgi:3-oxoacyl-[acyl-carrier-protein] synthase III
LANTVKTGLQNGVNTLAQHPELASTALLSAAGNPSDMHEHLFLHHLTKKLQAQEKKGAGLSGGSVLKLAKSAFNLAKKKVISEAKPHLEKAKHLLFHSDKTFMIKENKKQLSLQMIK